MRSCKSKLSVSVLLIVLIGTIQMKTSGSFPRSNTHDVELNSFSQSIAEKQKPKSTTNSNVFATDLFKQISKAKPNGNVIISPMFIRAALAMVFIGAEKETASELKQRLHLPWTTKKQVGRNFSAILNQKNGEAEFSMALRLFVSSKNQLRLFYNNLAREFFNTEVESIDFSQSSNAIKTINTWIEQKTNNKITNLMQPGSLDDSTSAIVVNAIYFKGKWNNPFSSHMTRKRPFWVSQTTSIEADTMYMGDNSFRYSTLKELNATAIELPFKDSDISMVIILPNERDGLANLEENISSEDIYELRNNMIKQDVNLWLPRFKIEFAVDLVDVLKTLGIRSIFDDTANLLPIYTSGPTVKISGVPHKAFIDVNEAGCGVAATSFSKIMFSIHNKTVDFQVDHPFLFAIKGPEIVYFMGHVTTL